MATHSLYRKYRPTSFADDDLVGQEHVVNTLRNAIALNRVAHAYLFCGPRGTGKTTTARLMAKAVNCLAPDPRARPCNACQACEAINTNATTDVIEIDAASNRGIDDIRDLRERVKYAPTQLKTKFYIIDEAHQITGAAANAFLKTLEEPPPHTRFILATTDPEELLATIVSRCQRFDFRRINLEATVARLQTVADREQIAIDDDALPVIARQATGSLRDALGMLDQLAVYRESGDAESTSISADLVRTVLGVSRNERIERLVTALADRDAAAGLREVDAAVTAGDDIRQLGRQLVSYIRLLMLHQAGSAQDADEVAVSLAKRFSLDELAGLMRQLADIDFRSRRATLPQLPLEIALVEGTRRGIQTGSPQAEMPPAKSPDRQSSPRDDAPAFAPPAWEEPPVDTLPDPRDAQPRPPKTSLRDRVRGTASGPISSSAPKRDQPAPTTPVPKAPSPAEYAPVVASPSARPPQSSADGGLTLEYIVDLWPKIRADVKAVNRRIEALLQQVGPAAVSGQQVLLESPYEFHRNRVNTDDVRHVVEDVITRLVRQAVTVQCIAPDDARKHPANARQSPAVTPTQAVQDASNIAAASHQPEPEQRPVAEPSSSSLTDVVDAEGPTRNQQEDDEQRFNAARNIFDAEEIVDDVS